MKTTEKYHLGTKVDLWQKTKTVFHYDANGSLTVIEFS